MLKNLPVPVVSVPDAHRLILGGMEVLHTIAAKELLSLDHIH